MDFVFADDARQAHPSRADCGPLVAIGGIHLSSGRVGTLERALQELCDVYGFPKNEQFKWSPGKKEEYQRKNLNNEDRTAFFRKLLAIAGEHDAKACVVAVDVGARSATGATTPEEDATTMFLERAERIFSSLKVDGVVVAAQPGGGTQEEGKFLDHCLNVLSAGTKFSEFAAQPLGVLLVPSRRLRLLQLADVVVSATLARIAGENPFSPPVFEALLPLFRREGARIGGIGVKIHPDLKYLNLYHWLLGDSHVWKANSGHPLPQAAFPYAENSGERGLPGKMGIAQS